MKIFKRNQLIILVIALILITAGYLNFTARNNQTVVTSATRNNTQIGDAALVSSNAIEQGNETNSQNQLMQNGVVNTVSNDISNNASNEVQTSTTNSKDDEYYAKSKLERDTMYSQTLETYQEMFNNAGATAEQKTSASNEITKINNTKNAIMIAENLIIAKGFSDVVIFANEGSISVVVKEKELSPDQIAQIQNIVSRELNTEIDKIHISTK